jgi:hypothetical protein
MKKILILIFVALAYNVSAQVQKRTTEVVEEQVEEMDVEETAIMYSDDEMVMRNDYQSATKNITLYTANFSNGLNQINAFLTKIKAKVNSSNKTEVNYTVNFNMSLNYINSLDSLVEKMGYVTNNSFNVKNLSTDINNQKRQLKQAESNIKDLEEELKQPNLSAAELTNIRNQIRTLKQQVKNYKNRINELVYQSGNKNICTVTLNLKDEASTPNNSKVNFVNMPGFEYNLLFIENPKFGVSASTYQGYNVKYMFTRGKSYFNLGVYKALNNNLADSTVYSDLFMLQFGQDFYPKHFGRGKRKYLNLYTGYQLGGFVATQNNDKSSGFIPNANISLGVELYKSKYILIDNKASYFLPLNELNRNMRGINYGFSVNFVF